MNNEQDQPTRTATVQIPRAFYEFLQCRAQSEGTTVPELLKQALEREYGVDASPSDSQE